MRFRWIDWNLDKIGGHALSYEEVEFAFENRMAPVQQHERDDGSFMTIGATPSGRNIRIIWRFDEVVDPLADSGVSKAVFVITAF